MKPLTYLACPYTHAEPAIRQQRFEEAREARRRFEPVTNERKTMTHSEILKAAEAVMENLGVPGAVCVHADAWFTHYADSAQRRRVEWRLSFVPQRGAAGECLQQRGESGESVLISWTEQMRLKYGPKHEPSESELAATLDAHRVAENAA